LAQNNDNNTGGAEVAGLQSIETRERRLTLEARLSFILGFPRHPSTVDDQLREESLLMNGAEQDY
jgi:hypothetical protein